MFALILKIVGGLILLAIVGLAVFFYSVNKGAQQKSLMVDELAKVPVGSSAPEVMRFAENLGFNPEGREFAIPSVVEMKNDDVPGNDPLMEPVSKKTDLSQFKNGRLKFGLSLFVFQRKGCEITFKDGKVVSTRIWWLD